MPIVELQEQSHETAKDKGCHDKDLISTSVITLTKGKTTVIDIDDFEWVSKHKWYAHHSRGKYYVSRFVRKGGRRTIHLHKEIIKAPKVSVVDHLNGNTLDNRKSNLRICTFSQNSQNAKLYKNNTTGYRGVFYYKSNNKWIARIKVQCKNIHLGCFTDSNNAAIAYNKAAIKYYGEFARLNDVK